jgi:glycine/D-amino acid oxidase-like deaminating enzyme
MFNLRSDARSANEADHTVASEGAQMKVDVVVVGGGVTGTSTAYHLAAAGAEVVLVERHDLNTQASGRNAGGLHGQIQLEPFLERGEGWAQEWGPSLGVMQSAIRYWLELERELEVDLEVNVSGGLVVAADDEQLRILERKSALERRFGVETELLDRGGLRRVAPYVSDRMAGGLFCPLEGRANPLLAAPALARAASARGARLLPRTELQAIERRAEGGFRLSTGAGTIDCGRVVDCAGAEAGDVAALADAAFEVARWPLMVSATEPAPPLVEHLVYFAGGRLTLKQARRGTILIGGGWAARLDDATGRLATDFPGLAENLRLAVEVVPGVAGSSLLRTWQGVCPGLPDERPAIGELLPGFVVAIFPFLGFTSGPYLGRVAARLALGAEPELDLTPFAPARLR